MIAAAVKSLFLVISALFPIVDPLGGAPIFLVLTREYSADTRMALSRQIAIDSFFLMVGSYFIGTHILAFFGISLPVVQVGGGLVVTATGWKMLQQHHDNEPVTKHQTVAPENPLRQAFYPLTLPLTVGPGSISVAITLGANAAQYHGVNFLAVAIAAIVASVLIAISIFLCYGFSDRLARALGPTAMSVIMQLASFLLVCIGVQILWNGVRGLLTSVPFTVR